MLQSLKAYANESAHVKTEVACDKRAVPGRWSTLSLEIYFFGWMTAFATLGIQIGILAFFVMASEAKLQEDTIDIQFTWKCPHDSDVCDDKADLTNAGWVIFSLLMIAVLAKDIINGCKLIYFSSKVGTLGARIRYFIHCWDGLVFDYAIRLLCKLLLPLPHDFCFSSSSLMHLIDNTFLCLVALRSVLYTTRQSRRATQISSLIQSSFYSSWR